MRNLIFKCIVTLSLLTGFSCSDDQTDMDVDPSNLTVEINIAEDYSGLVNITASAENTVGYEFYPGETGADEPVYNTTGSFSYTYGLTGVYTIEIRAFGSTGRYIKDNTTINVQVGDDAGPADPEGGYTTPLSYDNMNLVWQDEFNGSSLNTADWSYEIGTGDWGWGNNELQYYRQENTSVADGYLTIEAKKESFSGSSYTSSRLITKGKQEFKYGRIDIRARLPKGQGIWPALWMLGSNISSVGWPKCGEIDIMEMVGGVNSDNKTHGTIHWDQNGSHALYGESYTLDEGIFNDKFHVFTIIWNQTSITWYVDDVQFVTADITPTELSELKNSAFFIFNLAVGGNWPGNPDATTTFPQELVVDYIRVFQDK